MTDTAQITLPAADAAELRQHETAIERGLQTFYEVGTALLAIRDKRLYRADYSTFEDYCRERWQMGRNYVNKLITAAEVVTNLGTNVPILPTTESQARELFGLDKEAQRLAWEVVQQTAPAGKVTAAHVKSVVNVLKEVVTTGAIDNGTGESVPVVADVLKAAVTEETYERMRRQEAHIAEKQSAKDAKKTAQAERIAARSTVPSQYSGPLYQLYVGDLEDVATEYLPDDSVDFVITDPPYPAEYLPVYSKLATVAARVLKPGGSLLCMVGQSYMPEIMARLNEGLRYHWTHSYLTPGGQSSSAVLHSKRVNTFWKPVLHYVKGHYAGSVIGDVVKSDGNEKQLHAWQQSESGMAALVWKFTLPDQLILDPFCGAGTTGIVCVHQARRFIGIDIDPVAIATTEERLWTTNL